MQTAHGFKKQLLLFVLPFLLVTACGQKPEAPTPEQETSAKNPAAERLRALRSQTRPVEVTASTDPEPAPEVQPISAPKPAEEPITPKNKAVEDFAARLRTIIGDSYVSSQELKERAERGDHAAQYQLGQGAYEKGDFAEAMKWMTLAASQGNAKAQKSMGVMYMTGQGVTKDIKQAVNWYKMAADQGDGQAQYTLGLRYVNGEVVGQDFAEASKWFALAADQGVTDAQLSLARRYSAGEGVPQDLSEAYKWCLITEKYGTYQASGARQLRGQLEETITPEQIAAAKLRAEAFKPKEQ